MMMTFSQPFFHIVFWIKPLIGGPTKEMNIKAAAVFKSTELWTQEMVVFMVLNDRSYSAVDIISVFTAAASG
jgi:hypothetical protein